MIQPRVAKLVIKGVFGLAVSALIGYTIKMEHKVDDKIDEYYDKEDPEEPS